MGRSVTSPAFFAHGGHAVEEGNRIYEIAAAVIAPDRPEETFASPVRYGKTTERDRHASGISRRRCGQPRLSRMSRPSLAPASGDGSRCNAEPPRIDRNAARRLRQPAGGRSPLRRRILPPPCGQRRAQAVMGIPSTGNRGRNFHLPRRRRSRSPSTSSVTSAATS